MPRNHRDGDSQPLTFGHAARAKVRLIVWCKACQHQVEPDPAELADRHGEGATVIDWAARLRCSECGAQDADFVVAGDTSRGIGYSGGANGRRL